MNLLFKLRVLQLERKLEFLKSGRAPWSREEWAWFRETQKIIKTT
jgi:hypothetical protein